MRTNTDHVKNGGFRPLWRGDGRALGPDFDQGSVRDQSPQFFDFRIAHCNAAIGPVSSHAVPRGKPVGLAMNEDRSAGRTAMPGGKGAVGCIGIGNVQAQMIGTLRIAVVDPVSAFGRALVALETLVPHRSIAELEPVDPVEGASTGI